MRELGASPIACLWGLERYFYGRAPPARLTRGCALGGNFHFVYDRKSVILGVWAARGAQEALPKGGGLRPPPFARVSGAPGPPRLQNNRFPTLKQL